MIPAVEGPPPSMPPPLTRVSVGMLLLSVPASGRRNVGGPETVTVGVRLIVLPEIRLAPFNVPLLRLMVVIGAAYVPILWPLRFSVPPASVSVVLFAARLEMVVLGSRISALIFAVPPLIVKLPLDGPAAAMFVFVRLAMLKVVFTVNTAVEALSANGPPIVRVPVAPLAAEPLEFTPS